MQTGLGDPQSGQVHLVDHKTEMLSKRHPSSGDGTHGSFRKGVKRGILPSLLFERLEYGENDSAIARNNLLRAVIYPDSDDAADPLGDGLNGVYDRMEHAYNRQGELVSTKDQNETLHVYEFDKLGRMIHDRVIEVGGGIDASVRRISTSYEVRGLPETITSYDSPVAGAGSVVNEVRFVFNDFGQRVADYQEHGGAVDFSTSPKVQYAYADGSAGHNRLVKLSYPNGRGLLYGYGAGSDDAMNRVSYLADESGSAADVHLAEYAYLGLGGVARVDYAEPALGCDLAFGSGNDPNDGLDRFDRVVDLLWRDYDNSSDAVRIQHGYDRAGNRLWRQDPVAAANGADLDELYGYDGVNQLVSLQRGDLNAAKDGIVSGTTSFAESWSLDMTGNWPLFRQDADGDGAWELDQSRNHNSVNELTQIAGSSAHVLHDRAGNMNRIPKPGNWAAHFDLTRATP